MILILAAAGMLAAGSVKASLGWTMEECESHWGNGTLIEPSARPGAYDFRFKGYEIVTWFMEGKVSRVSYTKLDASPFTSEEIEGLKSINVPNKFWVGPLKREFGANVRYEWTTGQEFTFYDETPERVVIFTKADDDFIHNLQHSEMSGL